eukprot:2801994-Alexandrium_andersonii.AAC.1
MAAAVCRRLLALRLAACWHLRQHRPEPPSFCGVVLAPRAARTEHMERTKHADGGSHGTRPELCR